MVITKAADPDVFDKIDTYYISDRLPNMENVGGIIFLCGKLGGEEDDWIGEDGKRFIAIQLPYDKVRQLEDVRPMMLAKAKERLGLVA